MSLQKQYKANIKVLEPLKPHTTLKIGGKAKFWYEPKDLTQLVGFIKEAKSSLPLFVIGSGSNLLAMDGVLNRVFINLSTPDFCRIRVCGTKVEAGAGTRIGKLVSVLASKNVGGYEFLTGIPGTIGGALVMNAGAKNNYSDSMSLRQMQDIVSSVSVVDTKGRLIRLAREEIKFSYRASSLKGSIIVSAELKFYKADKKAVAERIKNNFAQRIRSQDWRYPSAGSFFKNPSPSMPAGMLIERCGLKGLQVGGARVSDKHANFIVNVSQAKSKDVLKLVEIVTKRVYNRFKIKLTPEVEFVC